MQLFYFHDFPKIMGLNLHDSNEKKPKSCNLSTDSVREVRGWQNNCGRKVSSLLTKQKQSHRCGIQTWLPKGTERGGINWDLDTQTTVQKIDN